MTREKEKELIEFRIQEIINRQEQLEGIMIELMDLGNEKEFDIRYGFEYKNLSDELYHQQNLLTDIEEEEVKE